MASGYFDRINRRYARHLTSMGGLPRDQARNDTAAKALIRWSAAEREAWLDALTNDPLLPSRLPPSDYPGQKAWRRPMETLRDAGRQPSAFKGG
ncbi:MAG: hypothetical protein M1608_04565 [Candidatus Omnitrophica bacterium]|nr:hypothetical protein [Candidatus Omnitrophota bacterium]